MTNKKPPAGGYKVEIIRTLKARTKVKVLTDKSLPQEEIEAIAIDNAPNVNLTEWETFETEYEASEVETI